MTTSIPMVSDTNCTTGEVVEREMTAEEIESLNQLNAQYEANKLIEEEQKAAYEALKASAKAKLIAGEPLTAEEADLLVI